MSLIHFRILKVASCALLMLTPVHRAFAAEYCDRAYTELHADIIVEKFKQHVLSSAQPALIELYKNQGLRVEEISAHIEMRSERLPVYDYINYIKDEMIRWPESVELRVVSSDYKARYFTVKVPKDEGYILNSHLVRKYNALGEVVSEKCQITRFMVHIYHNSNYAAFSTPIHDYNIVIVSNTETGMKVTEFKLPLDW